MNAPPDSLLLANVREAIVVTDLEGVVIYWNEGATRTFGWAAEQVLGRPLTDRVPERARADVARLIQAIREGEEFTGEWEDYRKDGSRVWVDARVRRLQDDQGRPTGIIGLAQEITDRKNAEAAARAEEARFRALIEHGFDAVFLLAPDGTVQFSSPASERIVGYTPEEYAGRNGFDLVHPEDFGEVQTRFARLLASPGGTERIEARARHKDGSWRWVECVGTNLLHNPALRGIVVNFRDITARKSAEERLQSVLRRVDAVLSSITEGYFALDEEFRFVEVNDPALRMIFNRPAAEILGRHTWELFPQGRNSEFERQYRLAFQERKPVHFTARSNVVNGWFEVHAYPREGRLEVYFRDVTEQKRAEEDLRAADRRKDEFLAMLAHELRNPLAAIGSGVWLLRQPDEDQEHRDWAIDVIDRQVKHLASLIDDLLDVSRITRGKIRLKTRTLDAGSVLAQAVETARPLLEERKHRLEVSYAPGTLPVLADPTRLEQIVVNLLTNAAKYTDPGGLVRLSAENEGGSVVITVRDNGMGIPPEQLPKMFELFAQGDRSLARSEGGLGIGLTVVKMLAELHGGSVSAASEGPGKGSEFTVRLPALSTPVVDTPRRPVPREEGASPHRILVVDDNIDSARGLARFLRRHGHEVLESYSGPDALERAATFHPEIVLLDIGLPGMDGYEVAERLRRLEGLNGVLIVAVSGYGQEEDRRRSREAGCDEHLVKPVDLDALLGVLSHRSGKPGG